MMRIRRKLSQRQHRRAKHSPRLSLNKSQTPQQTIAETPDAVPSKEITIKTPRYQVKLDSKGAVATSWILLKNVSERNPDGKLLYADGSNKENEKPLELIPQEALNHNPRLLPFRLSTGDANLDNLSEQSEIIKFPSIKTI